MVVEWSETTLDKLGKIVTGKTPPSAKSEYFSGEIPFVTPRDFDGRRYIKSTERTLTESGAKLVRGSLIPCGSIMTSCIGSDMGKVAIAASESVTNQQINSIVVEGDNEPLFVYYNLRTRQDELKSLAGGSAQPILNKSAFGKVRILLPPRSEQRSIVHMLGTLDDKIELNRKMNKTLESIARVIFKAWFIDFDPVHAKMKGEWQRGQSLAGLPEYLYDLFPGRFVKSQMGMIPEQWESSRVGDVGVVLCGKTPPTSNKDYYGDAVPFVTIPDLRANVFVVSTNRMLSDAGANSQRSKTLPPNAICVSCIATPGLVSITTEHCQTNQQINSIIPAEVGQTYFWFWTFHGLGDRIKAAGSGGSVLQNLSTGRFSEMIVLGATRDLRVEYHKLVSPLFEKIFNNLQECKRLSSLRDTLLPKLITGELRVKEALVTAESSS